eukprot:TRINITY_DN21227_c0_g1_i1.p1 TRINITY_DN21227_c0_g1~~TRINITY_DN21227_c0_g1_i1.p1  ORF type:complete len:646 (+),score=118.26 TRINITY_DN21227_c0_g1_i1:68-2005(+)
MPHPGEPQNGRHEHSATCQALTDADKFRAGLEPYLANFRQYAVAEVSRLEDKVAALSAALAAGGCRGDLKQILTDKQLSCANGQHCGGHVGGGSADGVSNVREAQCPEQCSEEAPHSLETIDPSLFVEEADAHGHAQAAKHMMGEPHSELGEDSPSIFLADLKKKGCKDITQSTAAASFKSHHRTALAMSSRFSVESKSRKQRIRDALLNQQAAGLDTHSDSFHTEGYAQRIVRSSWFENITMVIVLINAMWIAIDLDLNKGEGHWIFTVVSHLFCTCFTLELVFRFAAMKDKCGLVFNKWFLFDFFLVALMVIEVWIVPVVMAISGGDGTSALASASVLRLLRLLRVTRMAKAMRAMPELMIMIKGVLTGLRSVAASLILLAAVTYLFAILFRQLAADTVVGAELFANVPEAAYSLFIQSCLPDNGDALDMLFFERWDLGLLFILFLGVASLTIMNMLIGVMCEVMRVVSDDKHRQMQEEDMAIHVRRALEREHGEGVDRIENHITKEDILIVLDDADAIHSLQKLHVDVLALAEDADVLFDGASSKGLSFQEFTEVLAMFDKSHGASYRAMTGIRKRINLASYEITSVHTRLKTFHQTWLQEFQALRRTLDGLKQAKAEETFPLKGGDAALPDWSGATGEVLL